MSKRTTSNVVGKPYAFSIDFTLHWALSLVVLGSLWACKKSSSDPSPNNPPVTPLTCKPLREVNLATSDTTIRYTYDTQGRISLVKDRVEYSFEMCARTRTFTYLSDNQFSVATTIESGSSPQRYPRETETFSVQNGKIVMSAVIRDSDIKDTSWFTYQNGRLSGIKQSNWELRFVDTAYVLFPNYTYQDLSYVGENLTEIVDAFDSSGVKVPYMRTRYTYDTKTLVYVPGNPFSLAPGIDLVKITKQPLVVERENFHAYQGRNPGQMNRKYVYTPTYQSDRLVQVNRVMTDSFGSNLNETFIYLYSCK